VFVTHDLARARYVAQDVLVMFRGQIVERGPIDEVLARPAHPYTIELLAAARGRALEDRVADPAGVGPESCRYADRCPFVQAICRTTPPPEVPVGNGRQSRCHFASAVLESGAAAEAVAKAV
jgi:peptide/nickel transport system ATP-binding protein